MKKTYIFFVFVIVIFLTIAVITNSNIDFSRLLGSVSTSSDDIKMIVHAIDYGDAENGDAVLIESNGQYLLIDGGDYSKAATPCVKYGCVDNKGAMVIKYLKSIGVKNLSVYISHYDHDHYKNFSFYIIEYKENGTPYFHIDNVYLPNIENLKTEYNSRKQSCLSDTADSMNCQFAYRLAKIIGRQVSDNADKKVYKSGTGNEGEIGNYFDPQLYFLHYNLKNKPNVESDGVKYLTSIPNVESKDLTEDSTKITIGEATLNVIYHNPNTNPDKYNNYKDSGESQFEYNQDITEKLDSFQNNLSLVSMVSVDTNAGTKKFYMAGDIQYEIEQEIVNSRINIDADLMKLSHHGLETSNGNTNGYINKISPQYVFYQYGGESSYKNSTKDGKLVISYNGLHTNCGQNGPYINNSFVYCKENSINTNRNLYKIAQKIGSSNVNSIGQSGSIKYIFKNDGTITRQCATSDCKIKSINVTYNSTVPLPNNDKVSTANQTFVTDLAEPYKLGYNYFGEPEWGTIKPFGFGGWSRVSDGYALVGWSCPDTDCDDGNAVYSTYSKISNDWINTKVKKENITLSAVWKKLYTYTLDQTGVTTEGTKTIYGVEEKGVYLNNYQTKITKIPQLPTKKGHTFGGYYTKANGQGTQLIDSSGNITSSFTISNYGTLYPKWTANQYTVTLNPNGGSVSPTSIKVTYGNKYSSLPTPTKDGNTFDGWYTASSGGTKITNDTTVSITAAQTLYAHWTPKTYTVTFNANGGTVSTTSKSVTFSSTYGTLPTPTKAGSSFKGWYTATSGGTKITSSTTVTTSKNHTLYAQWEAYTMNILYNANGGTIKEYTNTDGKVFGKSGSLVTINGSTTIHSLKYGESLPSSGLSNYNNSNYIYISRDSYTTITGKEFKDKNGKEFSQTEEYAASDFSTVCDVSSKSCDVVLYVNWKKSVSIPTCSNKTYTGSEQTFMSSTSAYTTSNNKGTNVGSYTVLLTLNSGYAWSNRSADVKSVTCKINPYTLTSSSITTVANQTYTGSALTPKPVVKHGTKTLTLNTDYTLSYSNNTNVGTATITITGKGNYTGTVKETFEIYSPESTFQIIDSSYMKLNNNKIYTTLKQGIESINKATFMNNISSTNTWTLYDKNNKEITNNSTLVTTGAYLKYGNTIYRIIILGDIDQDGAITIKDLYQSYLLYKNKTTGLNEYQIAAGDYNKDGSTNIKDLYEIYKKMKGK